MAGNLFTGQLVRLTALNHETDSELFAQWDRDSEYFRQLNSHARPLATAQQIKAYIEKEVTEPSGEIQFSIRTLAGDKPIGFVAIDPPDWPHGEAFIAIGIGDQAYRGNGYGTDALRVLLRYAFTELNLQRVSLDVFEYNERAFKAYLKVGFVEEGRMRSMLRRGGRRWDFIYMGILRDEWPAKNSEPGNEGES